jgi:hypothetical protein
MFQQLWLWAQHPKTGKEDRNELEIGLEYFN